MAEADVTVTVKTIDQGSGAMRGYANNIRGIEGVAGKAAGSLKGLAVGVGAVTGVMVAAGYAAKKLYDTVRAGAVLETTTQRFDKLSESIGTTADVMLGKLKDATRGMISDAELMASASQIMSLKLADSEDQVVRLATVAGTLNWDMQQVILTFANMSTMRLDALGLSVEEVKTKAAELEKAGMSAQEAFKEAVILAGEARLDVGGVSETEQAFKQLEAAIANSKSELSLFILETAKAAGVIDAMSDAASRMGLVRQLTELDAQARAAGIQFDSLFEKISRSTGLANMSTAELRSEVIRVQTALEASKDSWMRYGDQGVGAMREIWAAASNTVVALSEVNRAIWANADAEKLASAGYMGRGSAVSRYNEMLATGQGGVPWLSDDRYQAGIVGRLGMDYDRAADAVSSYGGAVSAATEEELALAAAHERFMAAFTSELTGDPKDGLINEAGLVNVEAMNKALLEQAQAAGASATTLALLGVATGQFSEEQAEAALKAAVLQERIMQLAKGIASGEMSMGDALGNLAAFQQNIDQTGAGSLPETVAQLVDSIPADDRTVQFLSSTGLVDDDIRRLSGTVVEIPVRFVTTNDPAPKVDPDRSGPLNKNGRTAVSVDMNLNFNGPANANDVGRGVRDGMTSWARDLQREGVF